MKNLGCASNVMMCLHIMSVLNHVAKMSLNQMCSNVNTVFAVVIIVVIHYHYVIYTFSVFLLSQ